MIFDASSIVEILLKDEPEKLFGEEALDLTFYEVGSSLWRLSHVQDKITSEKAEQFLSSTEKLRKHLDIHTSINSQKIMEIAEEEALSFYDAAYIVAAKKEGSELITEDKALRKAAEKHVEAKKVSEL